MRILNRYLTRDFLVTFVIATAIFSFIMCVGSLVRAIDLMARGVSGAALLKYFLLNFPFILQFTIPMSAMTAALLLFARLSSDGEITAMKACGISLWQIVAPVVLASIGISLLTMYIGNSVSPRSRYAQRALLTRFADEDPMGLLEQGQWIREFPGLMLYLGRKDGAKVYDVIVYQLDGERVKTCLRARSGLLKRDLKHQALSIDMFDVRMETPDAKDPLNPAKTKTMVAEYYPQWISLRELHKGGRVIKKTSDYTMTDLIEALRSIGTPGGLRLPAEEVPRMKMNMLVEANNRMALALSCFAFVLLGIPLGLRSRRRESSVGVGISLLAMFVFYFFMMIARSTTDKPELHPDLIVWIPVVAAEIAGLLLIRRNS